MSGCTMSNELVSLAEWPNDWVIWPVNQLHLTSYIPTFDIRQVLGSSKHHFQAELKLPGRCDRPGDLSGCTDEGVVVRVKNPARRIRVIRSVKEVEEITAKFQPCFFLQLDVLSQTGIEVHGSRSDQYSSSCGTVKARRRYGKSARVEPKGWCAQLLSRSHTVRSARDVRTWNATDESAAGGRSGSEAREAAVAPNPVRLP